MTVPYEIVRKGKELEFPKTQKLKKMTDDDWSNLENFMKNTTFSSSKKDVKRSKK